MRLVLIYIFLMTRGKMEFMSVGIPAYSGIDFKEMERECAVFENFNFTAKKAGKY